MKYFLLHLVTFGLSGQRERSLSEDSRILALSLIERQVTINFWTFSIIAAWPVWLSQCSTAKLSLLIIVNNCSYRWEALPIKGILVFLEMDLFVSQSPPTKKPTLVYDLPSKFRIQSINSMWLLAPKEVSSNRGEKPSRMGGGRVKVSPQMVIGPLTTANNAKKWSPLWDHPSKYSPNVLGNTLCILSSTFKALVSSNAYIFHQNSQVFHKSVYTDFFKLGKVPRKFTLHFGNRLIIHYNITHPAVEAIQFLINKIVLTCCIVLFPAMISTESSLKVGRHDILEDLSIQ